MTDDQQEEQAAFQDAVSYAGMAWRQTRRLALRALTDQQSRATLKLVKALACFTLSLKEEFANQPTTQSPTTARAQAAQEVTRIGPRAKPQNIHEKTVEALGFVWGALSDLLCMPNRLSAEQRELAFAVLVAINEFSNADFQSVTPMESAA